MLIPKCHLMSFWFHSDRRSLWNLFQNPRLINVLYHVVTLGNRRGCKQSCLPFNTKFILLSIRSFSERTQFCIWCKLMLPSDSNTPWITQAITSIMHVMHCLLFVNTQRLEEKKYNLIFLFEIETYMFLVLRLIKLSFQNYYMTS